MTPFQLLCILVYAFGAFAFGTVFVCWLRETLGRRRRGGPVEKLRSEDLLAGALGSISTVWFVLCIQIVVAEARGDVKVWPFHMAGLALASLFPPLIVHGVYREALERAQGSGSSLAAGWRRGVAAFWAAALLFAPLAASAFLTPLGRAKLGVVAVNLVFSGMIAAAGVYGWALLSRFPGPAPRGRRRHARSMPLLYLGMAALFLLMALAAFDLITIGRTVELAMRATPLVFLVAGSWFESRFEFYDLVVKRAVTMLVSVGVLSGALALLLPALAGLDPAWMRAVVCALAIAPILVIGRPAIARLERWLDHFWLGRSHDRDQAIRYVTAAIREVADEGALARAVEGALEEIYHAPARVTFGETSDPGFRVAQEVPFRDGTLSVGSREGARAWLSEDLALLAAVGEIVAYTRRHLDLQKRRRELALAASRSELKALRAQINPHFLFNALNAIAGWIPKDPKLADRTVERLSEVFRYVLRGSEREWAALSEEIEFARAYLDVERARFGERLNVRIGVGEGAGEVRVPALLLQTLVENAVKHGVSRVRGEAALEIVARVEDGRLTLEVRDDGPGPEARPSRETEGEGFGLRSVRERLHGHFGDDAELTLHREAGRTVARIVLPAVARATA